MRALLAGICSGLLLAGAAGAATIEHLVMPGEVIEAHAEWESACDVCHASFDRSEQRNLCLDCHDEVSADVAAGTGFHGRLKQTGDCRTCHTEHRGRKADIVGLNVGRFDHSRTDFPLEGAHVGRVCKACHEEGVAHRNAPTNCFGCHEADDVHRGGLGDTCDSCHTDVGWRVETFDHSTTDFALRGEHRGVSCRGCHLDNRFDGTPDECVSCHRTDDVHKGSRGNDCGQCHTESGWAEATFDHGRETGFDLLGGHAELSCAACHLSDMSVREPPLTCNGCHSADDLHQGRNGTDCATCHTESSWKQVRFDHLAETGFALEGGHASLRCESCHRGAVTDQLEAACISCHKEDDAHGGAYRECGSCHNPNGWWDVAFNHDFAAFPLVGHHKLTACESCHVSLTFQGAPDACFDCHEEDDHHDGAFSPHCNRCHNPNGWSRWQFDHDADTSFALDGAHEGLKCDACHRENVWEARLSSECANCHARDDVHEGRFGADCSGCHRTGSFSELKPFRR